MPDEYPDNDPAGQDHPTGEPDGPDTEPDSTDEAASAGPAEGHEPVDAGATADAASGDNTPTGGAEAGERTADDPAPPPEPATGAPDAMTVASSAGTEAAGRGAQGTELSSAWPGRNTANERNTRILGELYVHYADRTVTVPMDADAALRAMTGWRFGHRRLWEDVLDPEEAPGSVPWAAISLENVLAMMWLPGLPSERRPERMALDPAVA